MSNEDNKTGVYYFLFDSEAVEKFARNEDVNDLLDVDYELYKYKESFMHPSELLGAFAGNESFFVLEKSDYEILLTRKEATNG
jgi:hypothetical protein